LRQRAKVVKLNPCSRQYASCVNPLARHPQDDASRTRSPRAVSSFLQFNVHAREFDRFIVKATGAFAERLQMHLQIVLGVRPKTIVPHPTMLTNPSLRLKARGFDHPRRGH
jgi:hypothetical protein